MNGVQPAHVSTEGDLAGTVYAQLMLGEALMRRNGMTPVPAGHVAAFREVHDDWRRAQVRTTGPVAAQGVPKVALRPEPRPRFLTTEQAARDYLVVSQSYLLRLATKYGLERKSRGRWNRRDIEWLLAQRQREAR